MTSAAVLNDFESSWNALERPFQESINLAWVALARGTIGVGSVITAAGGEIIARGRNSVFDPPNDGGLLQGTKLAHAEMNALVQIPTAVSLENCILWTTQQPCLLCAAAAVLTGVGRVQFLTADPFFAGTDRLPELNPWVAEKWPVYDGPSSDRHWEMSAMILHLYAAATRNPKGQVLTLSREVEPEAAQLIVEIVDSGRWQELAAAGSSATAALSVFWPKIVAAAAVRSERLP